jgi:hypothetical protein
VRLSAAQVDKLNALALKTCRPRGAVIRLLLEQATATSIPDIILDDEVPPDAA